MTLRVIKTWEPWDAWRVTNHLLSMLGCECPEADHAQIALYLAIALIRSKSGRHVEMPAEQLNQIRSSRIFTMLEKMVRRIPYADTVHFPDEELAQLSFQIAAHLGVELWQEHEDTLETASETGPIAVADQILRETHTVLGLEFGESSITPKLAEHIRRYLTRMRYGMYINNRFLEDVRKSYPEIFAAVRAVTFEMQNALGGPLPEDELAFITMYAAMAIQLHRSKQPTRKLRVVVVCPAGGITAAMLMFRLRLELPEIETVEVMSIKDLTRNTISNVDAIITTAHSLAYQDIPVITVHPLLGPKDLIKIRTILNLSSFR
jgi:mannitol operon transcriptional antiterminator